MARVSELRSALNEANTQHDAAAAMLATTPMVFNYGSGDSQTGYGRITSLRDALGAGWDSVAVLLSVVMLAALVVGPWLLALAGAVWLFAWVRRRYFVRPEA